MIETLTEDWKWFLSGVSFQLAVPVKYRKLEAYATD